MDRMDWILFLLFLQLLISAGILVLLIFFFVVLQGAVAASQHAFLLTLAS